MRQRGASRSHLPVCAIKTLIRINIIIKQSNGINFLKLECRHCTQKYFSDAKENSDNSNDHLNQEHIGCEEAEVNEEQGAEQCGKQEQGHRERVLCAVCMVSEVQTRDLDDKEEDDCRKFHFPDVRRI